MQKLLISAAVVTGLIAPAIFATVQYNSVPPREERRSTTGSLSSSTSRLMSGSGRTERGSGRSLTGIIMSGSGRGMTGSLDRLREPRPQTGSGGSRPNTGSGNLQALCMVKATQYLTDAQKTLTENYQQKMKALAKPAPRVVSGETSTKPNEALRELQASYLKDMSNIKSQFETAQKYCATK